MTISQGASLTRRLSRRNALACAFAHSFRIFIAALLQLKSRLLC